MKVDLKIQENDGARGVRLPHYIRKARGFAHLVSICTQRKTADNEYCGFDLGVAVFRDGTMAAIMWADLDLAAVKRITRFSKR